MINFNLGNGFSDTKDYLSFYEIDLDILKEYKLEKLKNRNEEICIHLFEPELIKKTVLLVHGYFDHSGSFKHIINYFLKKGWRIVSYDLQGHGLSSGNRAEISDFQDYVEGFQKVVDYCQENRFFPHTVIAHSTGTAICTSFLLQNSNASFQKVIFLAPLVRPTNWSSILIAAKIVPWFVDKLPRKLKKNSGDDEYLRFVRNDPLQAMYISIPWVQAMIKWNKKVEGFPSSTQEIYVIQGTLDETVAWKYNVLFLKKKFPTSQIAIIDGCRHQIMNDQKIIRDQVIYLLNKHIFG